MLFRFQKIIFFLLIFDVKKGITYTFHRFSIELFLFSLIFFSIQFHSNTQKFNFHLITIDVKIYAINFVRELRLRINFFSTRIHGVGARIAAEQAAIHAPNCVLQAANAGTAAICAPKKNNLV